MSSLSIRCSGRFLVHGCRRNAAAATTSLCRFLSTNTAAPLPKNSNTNENNQPEDSEDIISSQQPFVQTRFEAGEWDPERTNPLYSPKFKTQAKILSAEDYANRPTVGFSGEFQSFQDAMVTLSWMDRKEQKHVYELYLELTTTAYNNHQMTSHEYVMRVIAQKFNISSERVAAIVQLQHNEEQYKRQANRPLFPEAAEYMDREIQKEILDAYQTFRQKKPDEFVEDPVGVLGLQESKSWQVVEDVMDTDLLSEKAQKREEQRARQILDGHVYIQDKDDTELEIPLSKDAKKLLDAQKQFQQEQQQAQETPIVNWPLPQSDDEPVKRPRWKYVAQVVNTRELKKQGRKHKSYTNNSPVNTLVEQNGELRAATMADVKTTSWKPVRHVLEHTYQGAKQGWLDCIVRGDDTAWGKAPPKPLKPLEKIVKEETGADSVKTASESGDDSSSSSGSDSSSSSESEDSGSESGEELDDEKDNDDKDDTKDDDKK